MRAAREETMRYEENGVVTMGERATTGVRRGGGRVRGRSAQPEKQHATAQGSSRPKNGRRECDFPDECEDARDGRCMGGDSSGTTEVGHRSFVRLAQQRWMNVRTARARRSKRQPDAARACRKGNTVTYRMAENERQDPTKKVGCVEVGWPDPRSVISGRLRTRESGAQNGV